MSNGPRWPDLRLGQLFTGRWLMLDALPRWLAQLPDRWQWSLHNLVAHPLSEIVWQCGLVDLSERIHDQTMPEGGDEEAR